MDEKFLSALSDALTELNDRDALDELQTIKEHVDTGTFFVAFIGQYSAGKSSLLNNLIGRQLLPSSRVETTPILTYILYGTTEGGRIFYHDGNTQDIDLDAVTKLTQRNDAQNFDDIEHLEIFLDEQILADGMILLDTPGLNTIITRHENLLADSLSLAAEIIYVVSGSPTRTDIEKLQAFCAQGFKISFVRTHCDEITEWEETFAQVVDGDKRVLKDFDVTPDGSFFVSNLPESKYFGGIKNLRDLLKAKGSDVRGELERAASTRIEVIAKRAVAQLKDLRATLSREKHERDANLNQRREKIDEEISRLQNVLQQRRQKLQAEVESCRRALKADLATYIETSANNAAKLVESAGDDVKTNADMTAFIQRKIRPTLNRAFEIINLQISPILKDINGELVGTDLRISDADATIEDLPSLESYSEVVNLQDSESAELRRNLVALQKNRAMLETQLNTADASEFQNELATLEQELLTLQGERKNLGSYVPQMIQVEGTDGGAKIGRTVGNILDWAMIFLPQGAVTQAAKEAGLFSKLKKAPAKLFKAVKTFFKGEKVAKEVSKINKAKKFLFKAAKIAGQAKTKVDEVKAVAPVEFLDYLTLEHWGEKLGQQFDTPPRFEEDMNYRKNFFEQKRQIEQEILQTQQKIFRRKETLGAFKNEQERRAARLASLEVDEKLLNQKLASSEEKLRNEAAQSARKAWKLQWANYCRDVLKDFLSTQTERYLAELPERLEIYQAQRFSAVEEKLADKRAEYDSLAEMHEDDVAEKLRRTENILRRLEDVRF